MVNLENFIEENPSPELLLSKIKSTHTIDLQEDKDIEVLIQKWMKNKQVKRIGQCWINGWSIDWDKLYGEKKPQVLSLPTYPFARDRYEISSSHPEIKKKELSHPLVHKNTLNLSSLFSRNSDRKEFFLKDRVLSNEIPRISLPTYPFSRGRYWLPQREKQFSTQKWDFLHPLVHKNTSSLKQHRFSSTFSGEEFFLRDHVVKGFKILPGVVHLEIARAAIAQGLEKKQSFRLKDITWVSPASVQDQPIQVHTELSLQENEEIIFKIYSESGVLYSQGKAEFFDSKKIPQEDIPSLQTQCSQNSFSGKECYEAFAQVGMDYGPTHQAIETVFLGESQILAKLSLPPSLEKINPYVLHPSLMDSALQASIGILIDSTETTLGLFLPVSLSQLEIFSPCPPDVWAVIRFEDPTEKKWDIRLCDGRGNVCVEMKGFSAKRLDSLQPIDSEIFFFEPGWEEPSTPVQITEDYNEHLVILCELENLSPKSIEEETKNIRCISLQTQDKNLEKRFLFYAQKLFQQIQSLFQEKKRGKVLLQLLVPDYPSKEVFSSLVGILKTAQLENPSFVGQLLCIDPTEKPEKVREQIKESSLSPKSNQVLYRKNKRWEIGWKEMDASKELSLPWKDHGIYLITGGLGGLGFIFAKEIAQKAKHVTLILTGRSAANKNSQARLQELQLLTERAEYQQGDISDKEWTENLIENIHQKLGKIDGILHCAGIIQDNLIVQKTKEDFERVLAPKVSGVVNLDQASRKMELSFFVCFSSISGVLGNVGQADYAVANAFLDTYAQYRHDLVAMGKRHGQTLSINWPLWQEGGMGVSPEKQTMLKESTGMIPLDTETGIESFYRCFSLEKSQVMVIRGNRPQVTEKILNSTPFPAPRGNDSKALLEQVRTNLLEELITLSEKERQTIVTERIVEQVSAILKLPAHQIDVKANINLLGLSSIMAGELTTMLQKTLGIEIPIANIMQDPSIEELSDMILAELITEEDEILANIDNLSEEELDALLEQED